MEKSVLNAKTWNEEMRFIGLSLLGCGLITIGSWIRIPFCPVPFTLQTLAIFMLALTQSPKQACSSVICYLLCATIGLPVLDGKVNSLWIVGKCGGYLLSFPVAVYVIAKLRQKWPPFVALLFGEVVILFFGWVWLIPFIGPKLAFMKGVLLFIPSGILKACAALSIVKWRNR